MSDSEYSEEWSGSDESTESDESSDGTESDESGSESSVSADENVADTNKLCMDELLHEAKRFNTEAERRSKRKRIEISDDGEDDEDDEDDFTEESVSQSLCEEEDDMFQHDVAQFTENKNYVRLFQRFEDNVMRVAREFGAVTNSMRPVVDAAAQCGAWQLKKLPRDQLAKHTLAKGGFCTLCQTRKAVTYALVGENDNTFGHVGLLCAKRYDILLFAYNARNQLLRSAANGHSGEAAEAFMDAYAQLLDGMRDLEKLQKKMSGLNG